MKKSFTFRQVRRPLLQCFLFLVVCTSTLPAKAAVSTGDIAVIGMNCDNSTSLTKTFSIVVLADLGAGELIWFSDKAYYAGAFGPLLLNGSEGRFSWSIPAGGVAKGRVIMFSLTSGASPSVTTSPVTGTCTIAEGWTSTSPTVSPFGQNGDNILVYTGTEAAPSFIFGFNSGNNATGSTNGWNTGLVTNPNGACEKPAALAHGTTAVGLGGTLHFDNYIYNGIRVGTKAALLTLIGNPANWVYRADDATAYDLAPGGTEFSGGQPIFTISGTTLPVHLLSFTGNASGNMHGLKWKVENETAFAFYAVERSTDAVVFNTAGTVQATGANQYSFSNPSLHATAYYRLKMVDFDGNFTYSGIIVIAAATTGTSISLSPNPVQNWLTVNGNSGIRKIVITDLLGNNVLTIRANNEQTNSFSISQLKNGTYLVHVTSGEQTTVKKIIKQ